MFLQNNVYNHCLKTLELYTKLKNNQVVLNNNATA